MPAIGKYVLSMVMCDYYTFHIFTEDLPDANYCVSSVYLMNKFYFEHYESKIEKW